VQQLQGRKQEGNGQQASAATNFRDENRKRILNYDALDPSVAYATELGLVAVAVGGRCAVGAAGHPLVAHAVGAGAIEVGFGGLFSLGLGGVHRRHAPLRCWSVGQGWAVGEQKNCACEGSVAQSKKGERHHVARFVSAKMTGYP
jgi:hypothetical protein